MSEKWKYEQHCPGFSIGPDHYRTPIPVVNWLNDHCQERCEVVGLAPFVKRGIIVAGERPCVIVRRKI